MAGATGEEGDLGVIEAGVQGLDFWGGLRALFRDRVPGSAITKSHVSGFSAEPNFIASLNRPKAPKADAEVAPSPVETQGQPLVAVDEPP